MKVSTGLFYSVEGGPSSRAALRCQRLSRSLLDELVRAVGLDLEDVELRVQRVVRLRREGEVATEDEVLDPHVLDPADYVAPVLDDAVFVGTGLLDRLEQDLNCPIRGRPERANRLPGVVLEPSCDDR